jgi:hypothetical protein
MTLSMMVTWTRSTSMVAVKTGKATRSSRVAMVRQSGGHGLSGSGIDVLEVGRRQWLVWRRNNGSTML